MRKIFHSSAKSIFNDSYIDEAFGSMHQIVMTNIKKLLVRIGFLKQLWNIVLRFWTVSIEENRKHRKMTIVSSLCQFHLN